jgi:DNA modification methylase
MTQNDTSAPAHLDGQVAPYYEDELVILYHGDALDILPTLKSVDLVVTDPAYAFGLASTSQEGKAGGWGDLMNNARWYAEWLRELRRLTENKGGAAWVFNSWRSFPTLARASFEALWPIVSLAVWDKMWIGPGGSQGLRPSYELMALFAHPAFAVVDRGVPDIIRFQWASQRPNGHAAEKPVGLISRLIQAGPAPEVVLDPFVGSGTTLRAAKDLGIRSIGIEVEERWCEVAARRMGQEAMAL